MPKDDEAEQAEWTRLLTDYRTIGAAFAVIMVVVLILALGGRDPVRTNDDRIDRETKSGQVSQVAQAPDGSTVWAVRTHGRLVLFGKGTIVTTPG